jgi:alanyl-tRNA synthetase
VQLTGDIGLVKLFSVVGLRGGSRIEMACGGRALELMNRAYEQNRLVSQAFSAKISETAEAARKMNDALAAEKQRAAALMGTLFDTVAAGYAGKANVLHFEDGLEPVQVRLLADKIAGTITGWCAVFSGGCYCLATRQGDLRGLNQAMTAALGGRGGGKPNFQQGSVQAEKAEIEAFFSRVEL